MNYKFLIEASGCLTSGYMINSIHEAGYKVCGSDIVENVFAKYLSDDFLVFPKASDPDLWNIMENAIKEHNINIVLPTLDETMLGWAERKEYFEKKGVHVIVSEKETIDICEDKWKTYNFFKRSGLPTPKTSLAPDYELIKPRQGRGGKGIFLKSNKDVDNMNGMISQEIIDGIEYTVDVFFDYLGKPVYIVPRLRENVRDGKSVQGRVVKHEKIDAYIKKAAENIKFFGPVNFQFMETKDGDLFFIEINPRLGGGSALGFFATENWIKLIVSNLIEKKDIVRKSINYDAKMMRYYAELFV